MSEQVGSVTHKKSSDFHGGIRFQSSFTIRWELEDKNSQNRRYVEMTV